jgi:hypothetical protein
MASAPWKDVEYGDGLIRFRIPPTWNERTEDDGGGLFYGDEAELGALRVKIMTFTSQQSLPAEVAYTELQALDPAPGQEIERLPNGNALRRHREEASAVGEKTVLHIWMLASVAPPHRLVLAVFSLILPAATEEEPEIQAMVEALAREIRAARFRHQAAAA